MSQVKAVSVDDLPVGGAPGPLLQVISNPAAIREVGGPVAQGGRLCGAGWVRPARHVDVVVSGHGAVAEGPEVAARVAADHAYIDALRRGEGPVDARPGQD